MDENHEDIAKELTSAGASDKERLSEFVRECGLKFFEAEKNGYYEYRILSTKDVEMGWDQEPMTAERFMENARKGAEIAFRMDRR